MCKVSNFKSHSQLSQQLVKICEIKYLPMVIPYIHLTHLVKWQKEEF